MALWSVKTVQVPGLASEYASSGPIAAQSRRHYILDTTSNAITVNLPSGVDGQMLRITDAKGTFLTNNVTVVPATGQKINNLATNESLLLDANEMWIELTWNALAGSWIVNAPGILGLIANTYTDYPYITSPASPAASTLRLYAKSDGKLYTKDSAGAEKKVGGGLDHPTANSTFEVDGYNAGLSGTANTAIGVGTGINIITGSSNTFFGANAGNAISNTSFNTFIGSISGIYATGNRNTFVGRNSGGSIGAGDYNTLVGQSAGGALTTGSNNTLLGGAAYTYVTDGTGNVAIGYFAGSGLTAASYSYNTIINSDGAAAAQTVGYNGAVVIGRDSAGTSSVASANNQFVLGTSSHLYNFPGVAQTSLVLGPTGTSTGQTGVLRFRELAANGTNSVALRAPDSIASDVILTLPSTAGSANQVLTTNGSGTLSWTTPSGGSSVVENFSNADHIISTNQTLSLVQSTIKSDLGSSITTGERILFRGQTNSSENGIYSYSSFAIVPATFNSLNYPELAGLTFTLTSINWTTSYFGWPPPSTKDTAIGTQWDFGFNPASAQTAYISSDNKKIVVYDSNYQIWIALKFNATIPLLSTPDMMNFENWNTTSNVGITVTNSNNPDITIGNTLYQAGTPTNAVYSRVTDADISAEFFYGRAVSTPSGMYRYTGISSPTLGSTSLPFDRVAINQAFEQDNSTSFGDIKNKCLIINATSSVTISSITNSVIIFTNLVNVTITNTVSNSYISGPMSPSAISNNFTINGTSINGSDIKWRGNILIPSSCEINHTNISCSSLFLGSQSSSNLITSNYAFIRAGNVYVYDDIRFDNSDVAGYFYAQGGTNEFITLNFRINTIFTGSVSMDSLNSTLSFGFNAIANIADLLINSTVGTVRFNVSYGSVVNIGKAKLNTGVFAYSFNISNESEVKIGSLYTLNSFSVTTPNNSTLMIGVIYPGSGTVNTAPANSRNFVSHNDSETWHTAAGVWGTN